MIPGVLNLTVYQGDRYEIFFRVRDEVWNEGLETWEAGDYADLTGYTVRSQVRNLTSGVLEAEFACTLQDQSASPGSVLCVLTPAKTATLSVGTGHEWDVELEGPGGPEFVETYLRGSVTVLKEVTRSESQG